jgi:hypothetical protein
MLKVYLLQEPIVSYGTVSKSPLTFFRSWEKTDKEKQCVCVCVSQIMYTHVSKCKNYQNKILKEEEQ